MESKSIYTMASTPPHIHAEYGSDEVLLVIEDGEIYERLLTR
jgi:hypothetical protein